MLNAEALERMLKADLSGLTDGQLTKLFKEAHKQQKEAALIMRRIAEASAKRL